MKARSRKRSRRLSSVAKNFSRRKRKRKSSDQQYEKLEPRKVLNAVPVGISNLDYYTPLNTDLTITNTNEGVLANDFDAEGDTLTAVSFGNAENGTLTSTSSDGTFTFKPDTSFQGFASFTYVAYDGTGSSVETTVKVAVGDGLSAQLNGDERGVNDNFLHSGILNLTQPLGSGIDLVYRSDTTPVALVPVETFIIPGTAIPDSVDVSLTIAGVTTNVTFTDGDLVEDEALRIVLRARTEAVSTGMYDWDMDVTLVYSGQADITRTYEGQQAIVNRTTSYFGKNWWVDGLDQLYQETDGVLLVNGDGTTLWFGEDGSDYLKAPGDQTFSTLADTGAEFTLTDKWGNVRTFNSDGYITEIRLVNNSVAEYEFSYDSSNKITKITDQFDREFTFNYTQWNKVDDVNDFAGRTTDFAIGSGLLKRVRLGQGSTAPAEFDTTGYTSPRWKYNYQTIGGYSFLNSVNDPSNITTKYIYDNPTRRIKQIENGDLTDSYLWPALTQGFQRNSGYAILHVADADPRFTNELGKTIHFRTNGFGNLTYVKDARGAISKFEIDQHNRIFRATGADPDDGSQSIDSPITTFGYNWAGDLKRTNNADGTFTKIAYDTTFHVPTFYWNELNEVDTFTYDSVGNLLTTMDAEGNTWTYTYDVHGNVLTETSPDPDGGGALEEIVTTYDYETTIYNRLEKITWEDGEFQTFTYTLSDGLKSSTDELGNTISYVYDPLDRLVELTLPDPDAIGSGEDAPVYTYSYDSNLRLESETDALGNVTEYDYHATRHWLTKITLPDPDGTGDPTLTSPEIDYTYNAGGQLVTEVRPEFDGTSITYTYDNNGNLKTRTGPVSGQVFTFTYDFLNRLTSQTNPSGREINYEYDVVNQLVKVIDDLDGGTVGPTTKYEYDDAGRLSAMIDPLGRTTSYGYYDNGWLETMTLPDPDKGGEFDAPVYTYEYDTLGRQTKTIDPGTRETISIYNTRHQVVEFVNHDPDGDGPLSPTSTLYGYDEAGRLENTTNALGQVTTYTYDNLGRTISVELPDPDTGLLSANSPKYQYAYDAVGNMLTFTDAEGNDTTVEYDDL